MRLRHPVLGRRIAGFTWFRSKLSFSTDALLQLRLHFVATSLLKWIGAAEREQCKYDREQRRPGLHPLILETKQTKANGRCSDVRSQQRILNSRLKIKRLYNSLEFVYALNVIDSELLLQGYRLGVFPMAMEDDSIAWFSPDPRAIIPLEKFHVPHGLRRLARKNVFEIKMDHAFSEVIRSCAKRRDTWINPEITGSYERLHELGHAHSVEAWKDDKLAGGLYGVAVGGAFFGESMFHRVTDASKIALVALVQHLRARKFALLDTQWITPHLEQFGALEIPREQYLKMLRLAVELPRKFL